MDANRHSRTRHAPGYSLLELLVVVALLAVLSGAVLPAFQGSVSGIQSDHAVRDLVASIKYAQERAVSDGREYRIYFAQNERGYWIAALASHQGSEKIFEAISERHGEPMTFPERLSVQHLRTRKDSRTNLRYIAFLPNGACDKASLAFHNARGQSVTVETNGTFGELKVNVS